MTAIIVIIVLLVFNEVISCTKKGKLNLLKWNDLECTKVSKTQHTIAKDIRVLSYCLTCCISG